LKYKHHDFMTKPILDLSNLRSDKSSYRNYPIQPILERCIRLNTHLTYRSYYYHYDPRPEGAEADIFLRRSLVDKLKNIDRKLHNLGLSLLIQEGYRPISVQRFVQEVSVLKGLRKEYPRMEETELQEKVKQFAASANGNINISPPPHLTGGAVDLTLVYLDNGEQVDMGKSRGLFGTAFPDTFESQEGFEDPRSFRRLLFWLAQEQEIVTNPSEWWHLCWGDQMWAWATKAKHAFYGVADHFDQVVGL
jgi:zinc D-Ala-D-Ala dipeptidase